MLIIIPLVLVLLAGIAALLFVVALPIVLAGAVIGVILYALIGLLLLPVRLVGWTLAAGAGGLLLLLKLFLLFVLGLVGMAVLMALSLPLLPFLLVGAGLWLLLRSRRRAVPV